MPQTGILNPHPREFERCLYASVGEDRNGYVVTVLSTLARLGLDPWKETTELVALGHDAARAWLGTLLARFRDVPALATDHGRVAQDLSQLLPEAQMSATLKRADLTVADRCSGTSGAVWAVLAIILLLFQTIFIGGAGSGE